MAESDQKIESRVRQRCLERFREAKLLERILPDIENILTIPEAGPIRETIGDVDVFPTGMWVN